MALATDDADATLSKMLIGLSGWTISEVVPFAP